MGSLNDGVEAWLSEFDRKISRSIFFFFLSYDRFGERFAFDISALIGGFLILWLPYSQFKEELRGFSRIAGIEVFFLVACAVYMMIYSGWRERFCLDRESDRRYAERSVWLNLIIFIAVGSLLGFASVLLVVGGSAQNFSPSVIVISSGLALSLLLRLFVMGLR